MKATLLPLYVRTIRWSCSIFLLVSSSISKTIGIRKSVYDQLIEIGRMDQSFSDLIEDLVKYKMEAKKVD